MRLIASKDFIGKVPPRPISRLHRQPSWQLRGNKLRPAWTRQPQLRPRFCPCSRSLVGRDWSGGSVVSGRKLVGVPPAVLRFYTVDLMSVSGPGTPKPERVSSLFCRGVPSLYCCYIGCRCPFEKTLFLPVRNVTMRKVEMTLAPESGQLSSSVEAPAFPSRPDNSRDAARSGGDGRSGAARSHAQRPLTARAWRGRRAPDLPWSEHCGRLGSGRRNRRRV